MLLEKSTLCFYARNQDSTLVYRLQGEVPTQPWSSNSVILSLAAHLLQFFPNLHHPKYVDIVPDCQNKFAEAWMNPLFEPWLQLFCNSVLEEKAFRYQNTLYICIEFEEDYKKVLARYNFRKSFKHKNATFEEMFEFSSKNTEIPKQKIAFLNFAGSQMRTGAFQPKIHLLALFMGQLFDNEKWAYYQMLREQTPSPAQLASYQSLIIPGSTMTVLDKNQKVCSFMENYFEAIKLNPSLKTLSLCYGHQLILDFAKAKIVSKDKFLGQQIIYFSDQTVKKHSFLSPLLEFKDIECKVPENHDDFVEEIPETYDLIGHSSTCKVEAAVKKDGTVLGFQFHTEYFSEYAQVFIRREQAYGDENGRITKFNFGIAAQEIQTHHESCLKFRRCMKLFLES